MTGPYVSKEDEGKWRCQVCKKLFKAAEFVEKHVMNKHSELLKAQMDEVLLYLHSCCDWLICLQWELFNNFILDPQHITPMSAVPLTQTGAAQHPPQAFGLPPDWRPPYDARYERNSRDSYYGRDRERERRPSYSRRSPSPIPFNKPIRFGIDADTSGITVNGSLPAAIPGLPAKPVGPMVTSAPSTNSGLLQRMSAPPPPGQKPDPRARVSYHDLDMAASEDVALQY